MLHAQSAARPLLRHGFDGDGAGPASRAGLQPPMRRSFAVGPSKQHWDAQFVASAARGRGGVDNGQRSLAAARRSAAPGTRQFAARCAAATDAAPQSGDEGGLLAIFREKGSKLIPMCALFFFMAFCNSVLDRFDSLSTLLSRSSLRLPRFIPTACRLQSTCSLVVAAPLLRRTALLGRPTAMLAGQGSRLS